jgi:3-oxoacyl-[acyl-carrier-protein] synthase III
VSVARSVVLGCGSYLPARILSNDELARSVETTDEWIVQRTGIRERHIAAAGELTSDLAINAARAALANAHVEASSIDLIVVATSTPDQTFPATAVSVQAGLGITQGAAFDLQAVCSGFVFALSIVDSMLKSGNFKRALVIGAETFSRILDWSDRTTCVLFGDGAGALVLSAVSDPGPAGRCILSNHLHSDGRLYDILYVDGGPSSTRSTGFLRMEGREVFRRAVQHLSEVVDEALAANQLTAADIDWLVPHQANSRIIEGVGRKLGLSPDKVITTIDRHANTSAASIPLALATAVADGRIRPGDLILMEALGGGLSWGASVVRW